MTTHQKDLVLRYFAAVDAEDLAGVLQTLSEDCHFGVPTHGVSLKGHSQITAMFERLWSRHRAVRHHSFHFVDDPENSRIAVQFSVENTEQDGSLTHKSNCNFFDLRGDQFCQVAVYMAGANTLDAPKT